MAKQHKGEKLKGRVKEAVGELTRNKKLQRKGKADQVAAFVKRTGDKVKHKATELAEKVKTAELAQKLKRS